MRWRENVWQLLLTDDENAVQAEQKHVQAAVIATQERLITNQECLAQEQAEEIFTQERYQRQKSAQKSGQIIICDQLELTLMKFDRAIALSQR